MCDRESVCAQERRSAASDFFDFQMAQQELDAGVIKGGAPGKEGGHRGDAQVGWGGGIRGDTVEFVVQAVELAGANQAHDAQPHGRAGMIEQLPEATSPNLRQLFQRATIDRVEEKHLPRRARGRIAQAFGDELLHPSVRAEREQHVAHGSHLRRL